MLPVSEPAGQEARRARSLTAKLSDLETLSRHASGLGSGALCGRDFFHPSGGAKRVHSTGHNDNK